MKAVIDSLESVPEALREHYEARGGKFHLKIEDAPAGYVKAEDLINANKKITEFRDTNIAALKELDELRPLRTKFEGLDPEEARKALDKVKALGKKGLDNAEDIDARLKAMVEEHLKPVKEALATSTRETQAERDRANKFLLKSTIGDLFVKAGGKPNAIDFVVGLSDSLFEVKDSAVVAKTGKFSAEKPGDPLTIAEWLKATVEKEHDYVFAPSGGAGAPPAKGSGAPAKVQAKPGQTILKDPTPQQLGEYAADIVAGKVRVEHTETTPIA